MPTSVSLPALGESVTEGTVTRWLKQVGDTVAVDEPLLEVSTDKVDTEIPSPVAGTLLEIKAAEDETVEVGAELAVIGDAGESSGTPDAPAESAPAETQAEAPAEQAEAPAAQAPAEQAPAAQAPAEQASPGRPGSCRAGPSRCRRPPQQAPAAQQAPAGDASSNNAPAEAASAPAASSAASGTSVTLPALGESVTEGTVTRWLKQVGDDVAVDEPLLEVSTDKVDTEIPSPVAGKLLEIKVAEDETVEVGAELAIVGSGDAAPAAEAPAPSAPAEQAPAEQAPAEQAPAAEAAPAPQAQAPAPQAAPAQAPAPQAPQLPRRHRLRRPLPSRPLRHRLRSPLPRRRLLPRSPHLRLRPRRRTAPPPTARTT